jgi:hypothetical protein
VKAVPRSSATSAAQPDTSGENDELGRKFYARYSRGRSAKSGRIVCIKVHSNIADDVMRRELSHVPGVEGVGYNTAEKDLMMVWLTEDADVEKIYREVRRMIRDSIRAERLLENVDIE